MTADEMFREMGYKRINAPAIVYEKNEYEANERIIIHADVGMPFVECLVNGENQGLFGSEILACAQLIKEMEVND